MISLRQTLVGIILLLLFVSEPLLAQRPAEQIREYILLISKGRGDEVAPKLSEMRSRFHNDPGVDYIEGLLAGDGATAIRYFRIVADSFPNNEWADDALARLAEIYTRSGLTEPGDESIHRLRVEYPQSPYIQTDYISEIAGDSGSAAKPTAKDRSGVEYAIQVGAFAIHHNAERMQRRFRSYGYRTDIYENFLDGKNLLYLVWVGSFKTMEEARQNLATIEEKSGIKGILRTRTRWRHW